MFRAAGVEQDKATRLASALVDWRDADSLTQPQGGAEDPEYAAAGLPYGAKDAPFETVAEAEQVLGVDPRIRRLPPRWCSRRWVWTARRW